MKGMMFMAAMFALVVASSPANTEPTELDQSLPPKGYLLFDLPVPCNSTEGLTEIFQQADERAKKWALDHGKILDGWFIQSLPQVEKREICQSEGGKAMVILYYHGKEEHEYKDSPPQVP